MSDETQSLTPSVRYANETPERRAMYEMRRRYENQYRAEAKRYAKFEAFLEAHREQAGNFFADKLAFLNAFFTNVKDDNGNICPELVAKVDPKVAKLMFDEIARIEKTAGFAAATKHETTVTHSLTDTWKQIEAQGGIIDAEVVEDE